MAGGWLRSPRADLAIAFAWLPFAAGAHLVAGDPAGLRWLVGATLLVSFAHQPLTLWLVYGDAEQRRSHRSLFAWAPVAVAVAVGAGVLLQPIAVALVAGAWNAAHTLRQRYGICRLYGRRGGIDCAGDHRLLWSWLLLAVAVALAHHDLGASARDVGMGARNTAAVDALGALQGATAALVPAAVLIAAATTVRHLRGERDRLRRSPARSTYLTSTALLLVVLAVDPVAGFVGYVGAHAVEYLFVVRWRTGSSRSLAVNGGVVLLLVLALRSSPSHHLTSTVVLTLGALHILYDSVIWRSPRPALLLREPT